eukprot:TRINITY_DN2369_c0_g1_i5.p1 TRINITY_DN2369_c0_g1~~TRINITY_DN2369_c0_g1_i5.p1  ORF type:complete len:117 (+),score=8.37 TRINITY_DN2369_c0_g1_i5:547-897(+)
MAESEPQNPHSHWHAPCWSEVEARRHAGLLCATLCSGHWSLSLSLSLYLRVLGVGCWAVRRWRALSLVSPYSALIPVSYTHLRAHETPEHLVCRLLLEKKKKKNKIFTKRQSDQTF